MKKLQEHIRLMSDERKCVIALILVLFMGLLLVYTYAGDGCRNDHEDPAAARHRQQQQGGRPGAEAEGAGCGHRVHGGSEGSANRGGNAGIFKGKQETAAGSPRGSSPHRGTIIRRRWNWGCATSHRKLTGTSPSRPGITRRSISPSAAARGKTGGACCSRRCVLWMRGRLPFRWVTRIPMLQSRLHMVPVLQMSLEFPGIPGLLALPPRPTP